MKVNCTVDVFIKLSGNPIGLDNLTRAIEKTEMLLTQIEYGGVYVSDRLFDPSVWTGVVNQLSGSMLPDFR